MNLIDDLLENTCRNVIKTILFCLTHATKGTIYRIGPMPRLQAVRVLSGSRGVDGEEIVWGLPAVSDYNPPGKSWEQYRDRPGYPLESMGWCVARQQSWTADNPSEDLRSVRKQLQGELEDVYHMEPVLVRKSDLYGDCAEVLDYPEDFQGNRIWQESDYVVVAVIKIHFLPNTITRGDRSTRVIKELSRSLGTELLTLHLRETLLRSQREFARQRLQSCRVLAHELRNTLIKFGFLFGAINAQIAILREEWEGQLRRSFPNLEWKVPILERLNAILHAGLPRLNGELQWLDLARALLAEQEELAASWLLPSQGEQWLANKVRPKWASLLEGTSAWDRERSEVEELLRRLDPALKVGMNREFVRHVNHLPNPLRDRWAALSYVQFTSDNLFILEEILQLLDEPALPVPHKYQMKKTLRSLKVLVEALPEVEERANRIILSLRYGDSEGESDGGDLQCPFALEWSSAVGNTAQPLTGNDKVAGTLGDEAG